MTMTDALTRPWTDSSREAARYRAMEDAPASPWATAWPPQPAPATGTAETQRDTGRGVDLRRARHDAVLVLPLLLVNGFAMYGQAAWALDHLQGGLPVAWLFAAAVESVALFLAAEAHAALMAGDAAVGRRVASYTVAGVVGWLNWTHWSGENVAAGAVFAAFSVLSPWLWAVRSKSMRRVELLAAGLVDARLPRFSVAKWVLHPGRTFRVWRWAAWEGVTDPAAAVAAWEARGRVVAASVAAPSVPVAVQVAPQVASLSPSPDPAPTERPDAPAVSARTVKPRKAPGRNAGAADKARQAVDAFKAEHGRDPSPSELMRAAGVSEGTARGVLRGTR